MHTSDQESKQMVSNEQPKSLDLLLLVHLPEATTLENLS